MYRIERILSRTLVGIHFFNSALLLRLFLPVASIYKLSLVISSLSYFNLNIFLKVSFTFL